MMAGADIKYLLDTFPCLTFIDESKQKIICSLTKHELPATVAAVESYIKGKKFKNASKTKMCNYDQPLPHIIPSTKRKHLHELFCTLTLRHIANSAVDIERHKKGKRFQRALARWEKCQETGERFMPRGGARRPGRTVSDNKSSNAGVHFWSNDSDDDGEINNEDMSDLYPAKDFDETSNGNGDSGKRGHVESLPSATLKTAAASDSDYEMNVLDSKLCQELDLKASGPHSTSSFAGNRSKKIKKRKKITKETDHGVKRKKKNTD